MGGAAGAGLALFTVPAAPGPETAHTYGYDSSPRPPPLAMLASVAHRGAAEGLGRKVACCSGDTPPSRRFLALFVYLCETFGGVHACPP